MTPAHGLCREHGPIERICIFFSYVPWGLCYYAWSPPVSSTGKHYLFQTLNEMRPGPGLQILREDFFFLPPSPKPTQVVFLSPSLLVSIYIFFLSSSFHQVWGYWLYMEMFIDSPSFGVQISVSHPKGQLKSGHYIQQMHPETAQFLDFHLPLIGIFLLYL